MAETQNTPAETPVPVEKTSKLKSFTVNHPRTARIVGYTVAGLAVVGAVTLVKNRSSKSDDQVEETDAPFDDSSETPNV